MLENYGNTGMTRDEEHVTRDEEQV